jgi:hypothetical protein
VNRAAAASERRANDLLTLPGRARIAHLRRLARRGVLSLELVAAFAPAAACACVPASACSAPGSTLTAVAGSLSSAAGPRIAFVMAAAAGRGARTADPGSTACAASAAALATTPRRGPCASRRRT